MEKIVVLIEDSGFVRSVVKHSLVDKGFEVYDYEGGEPLLHAKRFNPSIAEEGLLDHIRPDMFIIDVELKDIDGIEILKKIKEHSDLKTIPVIMNSSRSDKETIVKAITAGASDYVIKEDNFTKVLIDKIERFFKLELSPFKATLKHELEWVKYGNKELAFALLVLKNKETNKIITDKNLLDQVIEKLQEEMRHYYWVFLLDNKSIALILPLSGLKGIIKIRRKLLQDILDLCKSLNEDINVQIGFSHYPTNAKSANELISIAKNQIT